MRGELSSVDIFYLVKEFQMLLGGKIDKIYQKKDNFLFQIHVPGKGKHYLKVRLPHFMYLSHHKPNYDKPGKFAFALRRHLSNTRIRAVEQIDFERIVRMQLQSKDHMYTLYIELFKPGNIVLCKDDKIVLAHEYKGFGSRVIRAGIAYKYPQQDYDLSSLSEGDFARLLESTEKSSIVVTLAVNLGLGGRYAEEMLLRAEIDKKKSALDDKEKKRLFDVLSSFLKEPDPTIYVRDKERYVAPFELQQYQDWKKEKADSLNDALDSVLTKKLHRTKKKQQLSRFEKEKKKLEGIIKNQKNQIKGLEHAYEDNQKKGEFIYEKYTSIEPVLRQAKKMTQEGRPREDILQIEHVEAYNTREKQIVIEL